MINAVEWEEPHRSSLPAAMWFSVLFYFLQRGQKYTLEKIKTSLIIGAYHLELYMWNNEARIFGFTLNKAQLQKDKGP